MVSSPYYDNPHWEYHLPVNPPGDFRNDSDVVLHNVDIANWLDDRGVYLFSPRLRDTVQDAQLLKKEEDEYYDTQFMD